MGVFPPPSATVFPDPPVLELPLVGGVLAEGPAGASVDGAEEDGAVAGEDGVRVAAGAVEDGAGELALLSSPPEPQAVAVAASAVMTAAARRRRAGRAAGRGRRIVISSGCRLRLLTHRH
jgi:hypothetical protein